MQNEQINGARIVLETLKHIGVTDFFGYPGGSVIPIYNELYDFKGLNHIFVRHEQGAAHAADGYARATNNVGVCLATSGPGATNLVTGIMTAHMDSVPLVAITGQASTHLLGKDAFQESDIIGITMPITKHNFIVTKITDLPTIIRKAFQIANSDRKGPVVVDIPRDVQMQTMDLDFFNTLLTQPLGYVQNESKIQFIAGNEQLLNKLLISATKPVIVAGRGVILSNASEELEKFVTLFDAPVVNTLLGLGSIPIRSKYALGMAGMHGSVYANFALDDADLIIAIGMRFDDRITGDTSLFLPNAKIIHIDIDSSEFHKNMTADICIKSDAKNALNYLADLTEEKKHEKWRHKISLWEKKYPLQPAITKKLNAAQIICEISNMTKGESHIITDVGQHQMWTAQHYQFNKINSFSSSGGAGTMGYGLPAAIGVQVAKPNELVITIVGDGGIQMTAQEFITLAQYNLPVKTVIMNNNYLGMVRQWQELFNDNRLSYVDLSLNPDFEYLAKAYHIDYIRIKDTTDFKLLHSALLSNKPVIIECEIELEENVFPMIPSGQSVSQLTIGGDQIVKK